jgi:tetratricopeptide (TPR) repeat protein
MICLGALLLFVAGRCLVPMDETDVFFNLRLGELVLGDLTVPRTNLLSFTYPDHRDVNLAWLFQILLVLAHRAGGIPATVVLKTAFVLGTVGLLYRVAIRRGAHPAAAALALALSAWAAEPRFVERPHLVTFLGLAFTLLAIERAEAGRPRALYALVPIGFFWANANSCFFLAPVVLALYAAGARLDKQPDKANARRALIFAGLLVPLIFATPSGVHALGYIANHWRMPWLRPLQEYRAASWPLDGPFFFVAAGVLLSAALPGRRWRHLLPALALGLVGARRIRFVAEFALLSGPIIAVALTALAARAGKRAAHLVRFSPWLAATALVALTFVPRFGAARHGGRFFDIGMEPGLLPLAAIEFVDSRNLRDHMYNDLEVGSYLTWQGWPHFQVFQDPRINGYPDEMHAVLKRDDLSRGEWDAYLERFAVATALVTYPSVNPRAAMFDPNRWALIHRSADGLVFVRRRPWFNRLIAQYEIPLEFTYTRAGGVRPRPLQVPPPTPQITACEWRRRLGDVLVELGDDAGALAAYKAAWTRPVCLTPAAQQAAGLALGDVALRLHDPTTAAEAYEGLTLPRARRNRGLALLALGKPEEALIELRAALAADPNDADAKLAAGLAERRLKGN